MEPLSGRQSPLQSPPLSPRTSAAIEEAMGFLVIDGRDAAVVTRTDTNLQLPQWPSAEAPSSPRNRQVTPIRVDNDNNSNAVAVNSINVVAEPDPDLQVFTKKIWDAFNISYEITAARVPDLPHVHEPTLSTPLHIALKYLKEYPKAAVFTVIVCCLLEQGHDKEFANACDITPFTLAIESEDELILQLFTHDSPCKTVLLELAKAHKRESLIEFLEAPDCWVKFYAAAGRFVAAINHDRSNLYEDVRTFYSQHKEIVQFVFPTTGRTILHSAVTSFLAGTPLGIFECLVIMEMGGDKHAKNAQGDSPDSLAKASNNRTLIALFELDKPTINDLNQLIATDPVLPTWLNSSD